MPFKPLQFWVTPLAEFSKKSCQMGCNRPKKASLRRIVDCISKRAVYWRIHPKKWAVTLNFVKYCLFSYRD
jgi:hypothetical protein